MEIYNSADSKISVLCLQETWLSADADLSLLQLPGYTLISSGKSYNAHGGVAIYLHEDFNYDILPIHGDNHIWDGQFIEIYLDNHGANKKKVVLGNIYRPPRSLVENIDHFKNEIYRILNDLNNINDVILAGDFNLDLLKYQENIHNDAFYSGCIPKITLDR